ncbi:MAG: hypothetical protein AMS24_00755 [Chlamydiae bacterium SM23_39]|nr:MAG: hypothetical protein AMS24_00755 [Chlamydiae bacterium SM23_39]
MVKSIIKKNNINYIFFFILLSILNIFNIAHTLKIENNKILFFFHSFSQSFLETTLFIIILSIVKSYSKLYKLSIFIISFILLIHLFNFLLLSLIDENISYLIKILFGNGIKDFLTNTKASGIGYFNLLIIISMIIFLSISIFFIYHITDKLSKKKPFYFKKNHLYLSFFLLFALISFDLLSFFKIKDIESYKKHLSYNFFYPSKNKKIIVINSNLKNLKKEEEINKLINKKNSTITIRPNIYLFIIESFRKDFINKQVAPTLSKFKKENIYFHTSFSNANCTHLSWFSIFYSYLPNQWNYYKNYWEKGSPTLKLLKHLKYKINIFSSSDLKFFQMDKIIFGKNKNLVDKYINFTDNKCWIRDEKVFQALKNNINPKNTLYVAFLDSTHSEYEWNENHKIKFTPISNSINYLTLSFSKKNLNLLKNRYRNSINYLDTLFKNFFDYLKKNNLYDDAIIIITSDHGEEFFEEGSLFHGSHLNQYQLNIPIIYKLPNKMDKIKEKTSLIDIFPTIFHSLTKKEDFYDIFDGRSIFSNNENPFLISASQNGGKNPKTFLILHKNKKILTKIKKKQDKTIFEIISVKDSSGKELKDKKLNQKYLKAFLK